MAEENYVLDVSWADVNQVAAENRDGNLIKRTRQPMRAARDILPVSSNKSGELMARAPATHSFRSRKEYDDYVAEYPEAMKNGDQVWLQSKGLSGNNVYTLYEYNEHQLVEQTKIISGSNVVSGEGNGVNAVIWFTHVAPTNRIFVISDLLGPDGAVPSPGHMIVSNYSGRTYFVAAANEGTVTVQDYSVKIVGEDGYTPKKGVDYFTEADQESIVQQVITALGMPVFGRVDENNNIILTGELVDGVYTLKYESAEGKQTFIGVLSKEAAPSYINVLPSAINSDGTPYNGGQGWKTGHRLNSGGVEVEFAGATPDMEVTGFIPAKFGDTIYLKNMNFGTSADNTRSYIWVFDSAFKPLSYVLAASLHESADVVRDSSGNVTQFEITKNFFVGNSTAIDTATYIRINCDNITRDSIITVNQPII